MPRWLHFCLYLMRFNVFLQYHYSFDFMGATFSQLSDQGLRRTAGVVARAFGQTEDDVLMGRHGVLVTREAAQ